MTLSALLQWRVTTRARIVVNKGNLSPWRTAANDRDNEKAKEEVEQESLVDHNEKGEDEEKSKVGGDEKNDYHLTGWFLDIKPQHARDPPKLTMKVLQNQFDEQ